MELLSIALATLQAGAIFAAPHDGGPGDENVPDDGRGVVDAASLIAERDVTLNDLEKRSCWWGNNYGCSQKKKRCWRRCGTNPDDGKWCWLAAGGGGGAWLGCSVDTQCSPGNTPGSGCGQGSCSECGCSC